MLPIGRLSCRKVIVEPTDTLLLVIIVSLAQLIIDIFQYFLVCVNDLIYVNVIPKHCAAGSLSVAQASSFKLRVVAAHPYYFLCIYV